MNTDEERFNQITERIIGCAFRVHNTLGFVFLEKVYENALAHELRKAGLCVRQQVPFSVTYDGIVVGVYIADVVVEDSILVETKSVKGFDDAHLAQCLNYLTATGLRICLLINFGKRVEIKRLAGRTAA
jgi:GxxExxY protein